MPRDRRKIDDIRRSYDPQYALVDPHFTLVFPTIGATEPAVRGQVKRVAATTSAIAFRLSAAKPVRDTLKPRTHVFLTPDVGAQSIRRLHERLYQDGLAASLKTNIPYEPHVTVATLTNQSEAEIVCAGIGPLDIVGRLREIQIMSIDGSHFAVLELLRLN